MDGESSTGCPKEDPPRSLTVKEARFLGHSLWLCITFSIRVVYLCNNSKITNAAPWRREATEYTVCLYGVIFGVNGTVNWSEMHI